MASTSGNRHWTHSATNVMKNVVKDPNVQSAVIGAIAAEAGGKPGGMNRGPSRMELDLAARGKIRGTSHFRGKFKRPTKRTAKDGGKFTVIHSQEIAGTVLDQNCVYLTHASIDAYTAIEQMVKELVRKLMERGGFKVHSSTDVYSSNAIGVGDATGFTVRVIARNVFLNTRFVSGTCVFAVFESLDGIVSDILQTFLDYSSGFYTGGGVGNNDNAYEPCQLQLYLVNGAVERNVATVDLREEIMTLVGVSHLKVQNRSLAGDGSASTDNVNSNPVQGYMYNFKGIPKSKPDGMTAFDQTNRDNGVQLIRASLNAQQQAIREPVLPRVFWNCYKASKVRLDPGQIKYGQIKDKKTGPFLQMLKTIRFQQGPGPAFLKYYSPFKHQMIGLEEVINVDPLETITISYEVDRKYYIKSKTKRKTGIALASHEQTTQNNIS